MRPNILIADDASFIREILKTMIEREGWILAGEATDGEEVVLKASTLSPNVIIMDLVMPKLNGIEATRQILKKNPDQLIIGLSTLTDEELLVQLLEVGFISYIQKPFQWRDLANAIKEAMEEKYKEQRSV